MDPLNIAKKTLSAVSDLMKIAGANRLIRKAGHEIAKGLLTLARFVNVLLLPIEFLNWLFRKQATGLWRLLRTRAAKGRARKASEHHVASESELSLIEAAVLLAMVDAAPRRLTASELALLVRIPWDRLYLMLDTFERNQWLTSESADPPLQIGGPRRRYYQLTDLGMYKARETSALIACIPRLAHHPLRVSVDDAPMTSSDGSTRG
jgi:hypothetical protein